MSCQKCHQYWGDGEHSLRQTESEKGLYQQRAALILESLANFMLQSFISNCDSALIWYKTGMCFHMCSLRWLLLNISFNCQKQKRRKDVSKSLEALSVAWKPKLCLFCFMPHQSWRFCTWSSFYASAGKPKLKPGHFCRSLLAFRC